MVKSIKKIINDGSLSSSEISRLAQHFNVPLVSVVSMYEFQKPILDGCYVILIHPTPHDSGHWVGLYKRNDFVIYHDSYGVPPPKVVVRKCAGYHLFWTNKEIQDLRSNHCGQYVINFFRHLINSNNPYIAAEAYLNNF